MKRRAARLGQSLARGAAIEPPACQRFHARLDFKDRVHVVFGICTYA